MQFRACGCVVSYRFEIGLRDLEIGIGTEVGFSNRRDVEISPFSFVKRLDEIAPPSAGPNHVRCRLQKAPKMGCDSEISPAFRPAVGARPTGEPTETPTRSTRDAAGAFQRARSIGLVPHTLSTAHTHFGLTSKVWRLTAKS